MSSGVRLSPGRKPLPRGYGHFMWWLGHLKYKGEKMQKGMAKIQYLCRDKQNMKGRWIGITTSWCPTYVLEMWQQMGYELLRRMFIHVSCFNHECYRISNVFLRPFDNYSRLICSKPVPIFCLNHIQIKGLLWRPERLIYLFVFMSRFQRWKCWWLIYILLLRYTDYSESFSTMYLWHVG